MSKALMIEGSLAADSKIILLKKIGYLLVPFLMFIPIATIWLMKNTAYPNFFAYFPLLFVFIIVPLFDLFVGKDNFNINEMLDAPVLEKQLYYRILTLLCFPIYLIILYYALVVFTTYNLSLLGKIGWILSVGIFASVFTINASHELMHKTNKIEPFFSGLLLSLVCFSTFKIEHIRGHHVNVSTPLDHSSSRLNQSLYAFLWQALCHNTLAGFELESKRLNKKGLSAWHWHNELIWWTILSVAWFFLSLFMFGVLGGIFFLAQSFMAIVFLEIINYVEHYGLERKLLKNGKYEPVTHHHSWNSSFLFTNLLLFQLQRHSDHHAYPKRRYQILRHFDDSPQLPFGYATMILIALFPPLWFRIMNPQVNSYLQSKKTPS